MDNRPRVTQVEVIAEAEKVLGRKMTGVEREMATIFLATSTALNNLVTQAKSGTLTQRRAPRSGKADISTSEESVKIQKS